MTEMPGARQAALLNSWLGFLTTRDETGLPWAYAARYHPRSCSKRVASRFPESTVVPIDGVAAGLQHRVTRPVVN